MRVVEKHGGEGIWAEASCKKRMDEGNGQMYDQMERWRDDETMLLLWRTEIGVGANWTCIAVYDTGYQK